MNYVHEQLARATAYKPSYRLDFSWENAVQAQVEHESFVAWAKRSFDPALPLILSEPQKREPLLGILRGLLP